MNRRAPGSAARTDASGGAGEASAAAAGGASLARSTTDCETGNGTSRVQRASSFPPAAAAVRRRSPLTTGLTRAKMDTREHCKGGARSRPAAASRPRVVAISTAAASSWQQGHWISINVQGLKFHSPLVTLVDYAERSLCHPVTCAVLHGLQEIRVYIAGHAHTEWIVTAVWRRPGLSDAAAATTGLRHS